MASESIAHEAKTEPIRARGIIVKYVTAQCQEGIKRYHVRLNNNTFIHFGLVLCSMQKLII